ncbi:DUF192 domain-containing protein [Geotalea sp. SG265]|uniref:DUF192 domain-containing protein n=1 Tax=Geotalea sp. SG265 TaxID=2922867 RepID=UPI001FAF6B7C|nr:DUF192 domain-containing protein [Geotalea sp. SG265]
MKAVNNTTHKELACSLTIADRLLSRMKGLLGRESMSCGEGLWIKPCMSIHTFGMRFPIDVIFLNRQHAVVAVKKELPPNRLTAIYSAATSVLELPAGTIERTATKPGDRIALE